MSIGPRTLRVQRTFPARTQKTTSPFPREHGCRIVQGIWRPDGDKDLQRYETKIVPNVEQPMGRAHHNGRLTGLSGAPLSKELDSLVYAFDTQSESLLWGMGLSPLAYFRHDKRRCDSSGGQFRRKLLALRHALDHYEHVVWMDFDCIKLVSEYPEDFWDTLKAGAPIQAKIRQYHRRKCHWRHDQKRVLQGGAFIYCRSIPLIERCLEVMIEKPVQCHDDEIAIAHTIDEMNGGWVGLDKYRESGWDPPHYTIRGEIWPCERPVFTAR